MQRRLCKIAAWMMIVISQLKELTFLVSSQDLSFDKDNISVTVDGISYGVYSLIRMGDQWVARVNLNYCPKGDPLCTNCGQCHRERCPYFVRHCNMWK